MLAKYSKPKSSSKKQYPTVIEELCHQFSLDDLKKATNNFDKDRRIRLERRYEVYKGYVKHNGENDYPIALMRMIIVDNKDEQLFKNEIELHCQLRHPNLISLIGFCDEKNEKILVYKKDEMVNGSLAHHLCSRDMESLSWKKRLEICIGAAKGLHYLHTGTKRPIFHRDVKPQHILLDNNMEPKLCQLGLSLQGKLSKSESIPIKLDVISGTLGFIAPEYLSTGTFTDKCDVYSFVFMNITKRCLNIEEPNERPAIGEVEVELEHALALQEEADRENI